MNSQDLGGLASDQKVENVFHAFGYSIPVGKDGRRMWPNKLKSELARQMVTGKLTMADVQKTCQISDKTAYRWKRDYGTGHKKKFAPRDSKQTAFAELKVDHNRPDGPKVADLIMLRCGDIILELPSSYPIKQLAQLVHALDGKT
ncbi:hypothetical protein SLH49_18850 [Cognatiyoonia sp. IB215446]|uniref:hypothetical protein n=1 Tax=Cognatiyoonia sp. IB215446 TaxID=3097355 RepID=UPI002A179112|nr:hypothetical protein [Cognatiyoonia sp. IB215446]MDX8350054.1 hypothetical protein [Cognatiyoonia sp. IB215446]